MRRLLLLTVVVVATVMTVSTPAQAAGRDCPSGEVCDQSPKPGRGGKPKLEVPAQRKAYCDTPENPEFHQVFHPEFLTADDRTIGTPYSGSGLPVGGGGAPIVVPDIAIAQKVTQWCKAVVASAKAVVNLHDFWVPLATPDSVALTAGLLAKVQGRLAAPTVTWLDIDKDHGWLWVNIEHHAGITPPAPVNETATDGNEVTGYATAWVKATPVSFTIVLPKQTGVKKSALASCDLAQATSGKGCEIKFTHSSSISDDGWFVGSAQITWRVTSNSGKYDGVGPFVTSSEVRVQVAESMAVSRSGG